MASVSKVGVIGLGSMGFGIAQSLVRAGFSTHGADLSDAAMERLRDEGGAAEHLSDVVGELDALVVVVLNAAQCEGVLFGDNGVAPSLKPGVPVIACPTVAPEFAREMERRCDDHDLLYLDAPISGGSVKAAQGALSIMASGSPRAFAAASPVLDAIAETVFELGDRAGQGSALKIINQLLAGTHIAAMAEAITFGMTQGVDPKTTVEVIGKCAGQSWMFDNRGPHIVAGDYTPHSAVDIWLKDLGIVLDVAKDAKFSAPLTATALAQFIAASGSGLGGEDDAAVAKVYARNAGLKLPGEG
ncbi:NAD(P)-dependent oxidoreductase [Rhodobacteraceae bacterium NNCM2]|nr:NAD(P)-dependent oxidoreductase [Coraliihabitans acroporae]